MKIDYNIGDTVYILLEDVIRPVTIIGININKYGTMYELEHINSEGFKLTTNVGEKFVFKKVWHIVRYLMHEYHNWWVEEENYDLCMMPNNISTKETY